jgi:hypothetical protein
VNSIRLLSTGSSPELAEGSASQAESVNASRFSIFPRLARLTDLHPSVPKTNIEYSMFHLFHPMFQAYNPLFKQDYLAISSQVCSRCSGD